MYRTAPDGPIAPERALAEAGALDPAVDTIVSVREIDAEIARIDVDLCDASGARVRTTETVCELPWLLAEALGRRAPTEHVDAGALPPCAVRALERLTRLCAKGGRTTVLAQGADVRRERVVEAVVRRGRKRRRVWVGTSPVRLLATERYQRIPSRTRARIGAGAAALLTLAPAVALAVTVPPVAPLLVYAVALVGTFGRYAFFGPYVRYPRELPLGPAWATTRA